MKLHIPLKKAVNASYNDVIKSARNTEIQDVDPLAKSKDDGCPNFVAGFHCGVHRKFEPGVQRASPFTWMKWMQRQQRTNFLCGVRLALKRL